MVPSRTLTGLRPQRPRSKPAAVKAFHMEPPHNVYRDCVPITKLHGSAGQRRTLGPGMWPSCGESSHLAGRRALGACCWGDLGLGCCSCVDRFFQLEREIAPQPRALHAKCGTTEEIASRSLYLSLPFKNDSTGFASIVRKILSARSWTKTKTSLGAVLG